MNQLLVTQPLITWADSVVHLCLLYSPCVSKIQLYLWQSTIPKSLNNWPKIITPPSSWASFVNFLNGPNPASFCLFSFSLRTNIAQILTINEKSIDGVLGTQTRGGRLVGTDKSTDLWRTPKNAFFDFDQNKKMQKANWIESNPGPCSYLSISLTMQPIYIERLLCSTITHLRLL